MSTLKKFIRQIKRLFYVAPCGTVVTKVPFAIDIPEGKEAAKFNPQTGKLYWPSDGSEADGPGIRDIPNYKSQLPIKRLEDYTALELEQELELRKSN